MTARFQPPIEKNLTLSARVFLQIENKMPTLFHVARQFYAIDESYLHKGTSLRCGKFEGCVLQCCVHGLANGYLLNSTQLKVASYPVKVIDDQVFIIMDAGEQHE
ncbi:Rieske (2Fe-2S) protein [Acinetobacter celticus]|uniref:(2Fe-2S)-binding protein n=1 Tax=Acinetobacter celticus TaxID=1891224 RepID=A0A1C3CXR7_9GAMM|nr:(2Fe-2S)-binding protein [Acinetobacter celticus]ODA13632.1 (2Fe-2S)-binding protein [Acinetobacter celticus]